MSDIHMDAAPDQVEDQLTEDFRLTLLLATQAAQHMVAAFTERQREARAQSQEETRRFQAELQAHRAMALASTRDAGSEAWWQESAPRDMAHAWEVAKVWEERDPELSQRAARMREGFSDRFGIQDPDGMSLEDLVQARAADPARVESPLQEAEWRSGQYADYANELRQEHRRLTGQLSATDHPGDALSETERDSIITRLASAGSLAAHADRLSAAAAGEAERLRAAGSPPRSLSDTATAWDTPQRREALRERLRAANVPEDAQQARLLTDRAQGSPPEAAASRPPAGQAPAHRGPAARQLRRRR